MDLSPTLERLIAGETLDDATARDLMRDLLSGESSDVQIAGVLVALRMKGVTGRELASFAEELRAEARPIPGLPDDLVDTCGTGGGAPSFNLSTGAAIIAAAAGVKVAKHGNRAVTSSCGSADVLEALGVQIAGDAAEAARQLQATGLCFLFAPYYHPGMKHVGAVRRALGVRSVFNMLGPMVNPARAKRQLIGVYDTLLMAPMAEALEKLGSTGMIVCGMDGLDEVSPTQPTYVISVDRSKESFTRLTPDTFGIKEKVNLSPGANIEENASILVAALKGQDWCRSEALIPNAAVTLWLSGVAPSFGECASVARDMIESGKAWQKLCDWVEVSRA
jgi:anthranilate phosphoribosyltransferase